MNLFNKLLKDMGTAWEHPNYFLYEDTVCQFHCLRFPARGIQDYEFRGLTTDEDNLPDFVIPAEKADWSKVKILVANDITE